MRTTEYSTTDRSTTALDDRFRVHVTREGDFDPTPLLGDGWRIATTYRDAALIGDFDLRDLSMENQLLPGEEWTFLPERMDRLVLGGRIPLDIEAFAALWEKRELFPAEWSRVYRDWKLCYVVLGTRLFDPRGEERVLYFMERAGRWVIDTRPVDREYYDNCLFPAISL